MYKLLSVREFSLESCPLTGAEEMFVYGKTDKHVNKFEELYLEYPQTDKEMARGEELLKLGTPHAKLL